VNVDVRTCRVPTPAPEADGTALHPTDAPGNGIELADRAQRHRTG
jgi:hypothetical protein